MSKTNIRLRSINRGPRDNRYCGPAVVSFLTGKNTSDIARWMRQTSKWHRERIRGTHTTDVNNALKPHGLHLVPLKLGRRPTLAGWLKANRAERIPGRVFLLAAGNHWQLISGRRYACGRIGEIVSVRDPRVKRRCRVSEAYEVMPFDKTGHSPTWETLIEQPKIAARKRRDLYAKDRRQAQKIIKDHPEFQFTIEKDYLDGPHSLQYWVYMSNDMENLAHELDHELADEHYCDDWFEVRDRLQRMLQFCKEHSTQ